MVLFMVIMFEKIALYRMLVKQKSYNTGGPLTLASTFIADQIFEWQNRLTFCKGLAFGDKNPQVK